MNNLLKYPNRQKVYVMSSCIFWYSRSRIFCPNSVDWRAWFYVCLLQSLHLETQSYLLARLPWDHGRK